MSKQSNSNHDAKHLSDSDSSVSLNEDLDDPRILTAVQEFLLEVESVEPLSVVAFAKRYPDIEPALTDCLKGWELLHRNGIQDQISDPKHFEDNVHQGIALGEFKLLHEIGRGGMGVVYEAVQLSLGRRVAVKVLPFAAALDQQHLQRFKNEAQAAAQLNHKNIVSVIAVGTERGVHFYAMQLIEGASLNELIEHLRLFKKGGKTREETLKYATSTIHQVAESTGLATNKPRQPSRYQKAARLILQAAIALEHAHQYGVTHRDIKPANLLVDIHGHLWVTDFGLAQIHSDVTLTQTGDILGTARYMSPEQSAGNRRLTDHRTDIYSLGATLYELVTLEPIFQENDRNLLNKRIAEEEPVTPRVIDQKIPPELETIILKAISKDPVDRYETAQLLANDLENWLDDRPIIARRPTFLERAARWRRRNSVLVRSATAFVCFAIIGLGASMILLVREHARTLESYRRESEQRAAAESSFFQARHAVDAFTELSEQELADNPRMQSVRRRFLETALEYYRDFVTQRRDDPSVVSELAIGTENIRRLINELAAIEGFGRLVLLADTRVQKELALDPTQVNQLSRLLSRVEESRQNVSTEANSSGIEQHASDIGERLVSFEKEVQVLLNPSQVHRLKQIAWQQQTPAVFLTAEIVELLQLTPAQRQSIDQIIAEEGSGNRRENDTARSNEKSRQMKSSRPPMKNTAERATKRILEGITADQRDRWNEIVGEYFPYNLHRRPEDWIAR